MSRATGPVRHVLVTGGAGFIGSEVVRQLLAGGREVTVLDNLSVGTRERVPGEARLVVGDVRDPEACREALRGVDAVAHLAAKVTIRASLDGFVEDADVNLMGTLRLIGALEGTDVGRFVLASSMAVYADAALGTTVDEAHDTAPLSPYGVSKLAAERIAGQVLPLRDIPLTVLRFFNTFGPGQTYTPYVGVATIFITRLLRGESVTIFGDGLQQRDFVHVSDIASGVVASLDGPPGTYNLGTGRATTVQALADLILERLAPGTTPAYAPAQPGELRCSVADIGRARDALGYRPTRSLATHIDDVIADIRARLS
jgi:nucleoside-diphosphate-sugar epimerase